MQEVPHTIAYGATHIGRKRERNEDAFFIGKLQRTMFVQSTNLSGKSPTWLPGASEGWLLLVADGMGGQGSGDLASRAAVLAVTDYVCNVMPWVVANAPARQPAGSLPDVRQQLAKAVSVGESTVRLEAAKPDTSSRMGTTLTLAYILWPHLYVTHVGDSRCYLLRHGQLTRLTKDHTVAEQLAEKGVKDIDTESPWHHMLWNALGGDDSHAQPEVSRVELSGDDQLLLCSDGLTRHVDDPALLEILSSNAPVNENCDRLIQAANEAGGSDNITAILVRFQPEPQLNT